MDSPRIPVFDGHNDVLIRLDGEKRDFFRRGHDGHIDLPRAREGALGGGFCSIFTHGPGQSDDRPPGGPDTPNEELFSRTPDRSHAMVTTIEVMARLFRLEAQSDGALKVIRSSAELDECLHNGVFAALIHIEGAEAIDPDMNALEIFYRAGLRSLGLVWSRPNAFGEGVPFKFPKDPDTGPGLTDLGFNLVRACNRLGIMVDVSHLNEKGFWDVAKVTEKPIVATHSNVWTLSRTPRNLTDRQLDAIKESDGMVGVNFCVGFIREDGGKDDDTPLSAVVRHVDYLVQRLGIDRVGFGSDFDGAIIPREIGDATGLPHLLQALRKAGYDDAALRKLAHENWLRVLRKTWGA